jgi:hypothetical protein
VKPLTDPVGLRTLGFGSRVIDILQRQVQLVLMMLRIAANTPCPDRSTF